MAIIAISRGTFSGGKAIAEHVAEKLGYPCLSREDIVPKVVEKYGITEKDLAAAMDEPPPFWQHVHGRRRAYLKCVTSVMLEHVEGGNLVYHGHVGHLILSAVSHVLRVRVIADREFRIKGAMERKKFGRDEAVAFIRKIDEQRQKWTRFIYGVEWQDAVLYDVLFNLERMSIQSACDTIVHMTALDDFKLTQESLKSLADLTLGSRVWAALATDNQTRSADLTVTADDGHVTIVGGAGSQKVTQAIPAIARAIDGVKGVKSEVGIGAHWYW